MKNGYRNPTGFRRWVVHFNIGSEWRNFMNEEINNYYYDSDLPEAPRLEIYKETFGGLENITEEWYKDNRE